MSTARRSPLHDEHVRAGAVLTEFAGWQLPLRYGSETAEHLAVRCGVGLFDLSHMGEIEVTGADAATVLDRALVGDFSGLAPGRARYTLLCEESGGIVDDLVVYRLAVQDFLVVANAANVASVTAALAGAAAGSAVRVTDATSSTALVAVQGPAAGPVVAALVGHDVLAMRRYGCDRRTVPVAGTAVDMVVGRTGYTGEDGFEIYLPGADGVGLWRALLEVTGVVPVGLAARDTLRLEAGLALYGHELTPATSPFEAGLGRFVALGKPASFPGRAVLAATVAAPLERRLAGVMAEGRRVLRPGTALVGPAGEGRVTSGAWSPSLGRSIALAYLAAADAVAGTPVTADLRGTAVGGTVVDLPFVSRSPVPGGSA